MNDRELAPEITVVVPTRDSAATLAPCLASIRAQWRARVELIVVDNHSTDETPAIARQYADMVVTRGPERSGQRNAGWRLGRADVIAFVDSDMVLDPTVLRESLDLLAADTLVGSVVLPERTRGEGFWAACRVLEKQLYLGDPTVEAARVFRRKALDQVGGYDESLTAVEDWDLCDRVRALGVTVARTAAGVVHEEGRVQLRRQFAKKRYYGRWLPAYATGRRGCSWARPLWRRLLPRHPALLARHPLRTGGLAMLKSVEVCGLLVGAADAGRRRAPSRT